jgi:hypothetical protein|mmetsp:Transcript_22056/g.37385  ORF Transcript_22056/g.37385 Transcript_22056/m.37385 type:complete len:89 (-) Transcript_22056:1139-1405(-)
MVRCLLQWLPVYFAFMRIAARKQVCGHAVSTHLLRIWGSIPLRNPMLNPTPDPLSLSATISNTYHLPRQRVASNGNTTVSNGRAKAKT